MSGTLIDPSGPRDLFAELVASAQLRAGVEPTPAASAYLVELLGQHVRPAPLPRDADGAEETLAEGLLRARLERGGAQLRSLRRVGDRALFVAGFFGDSLRDRPAGLSYYGDAGRVAYGSVAAALSRQPVERVFSELFEELADRFRDFVELLTDVGDATRAALAGGLDGLTARYLRDGEERDRRRLLRRGLAVLARGGGRIQ